MRINQAPLSHPVFLEGYVHLQQESLWTAIKVTWHRVVHFCKTGQWLNHANIIDFLSKQVIPRLSERAANTGRTLTEKEWKAYTCLLERASLSSEQQSHLEKVSARAHSILYVERSEYTISLTNFEKRFGLELPKDFADMPALLAERKQEFLDSLIAMHFRTTKSPQNPLDATPEELLFVGEMNQRLREARPKKSSS